MSFRSQPEFLRCDYSKILLQHLAQALFEQSEVKQQQEGRGLFDCAIEAAMDLGLILAD